MLAPGLRVAERLVEGHWPGRVVPDPYGGAHREARVALYRYAGIQHVPADLDG